MPKKKPKSYDPTPGISENRQQETYSIEQRMMKQKLIPLPKMKKKGKR